MKTARNFALGAVLAAFAAFAVAADEPRQDGQRMEKHQHGGKHDHRGMQGGCQRG